MSTDELVREFRERGFIVARGFFSKEEISELHAEAEALSAPGSNLQSSLSAGGLVFAHNLFKRSELFRKFITQQRIVDFLKPITGGDIWVRWDQAVTKKPGAGVFRWHQDNGYNNLLTEHYQVWVALTETRNQNGGLWLAPGSHKRGRLPHLRVADHQVELQVDVGETCCIDATAGDLILFSSLMCHRTGPNEAETTRIAYVAEYMPFRDYDFDVERPFLIAATNGVSTPQFVNRQPGALSVRNQLMYWRPTTRRLFKAATTSLRRVVGG